MNPADRNKIMIAGGIALAAIIVIAFFLLRGRGGKGQAGPAGGFSATTATATEGGAGVEGGPPAPGEAAPEAAGGGAAGAEAAPTAMPMVGAIQMGSGPAEPTRPDPFLTFEPPPQPTPPELLVGLPPVGVVPGGLRPGGAVITVARVGNRRVAGVLFNDQAWAILEAENGETFIVKPGDVVDGIRITAIARDSIFLRDSDGKRWQVPLRGLGPGAGAGSTVSGMPETPPA
jgi:hypothetical protein